MPSSLQPSTAPYRLDELGWLQFERLCARLLEAEAGVGELSWRGHSDSWRLATVQDPLILHGHRVRLSGPVTVAVLWIPASDSDPPAVRAVQLAGRLSALASASEFVADQLLVLTNLPPEPISAALSPSAFVAQPELHVLGAREISASLDRQSGLRAALPSVLGLRDLTPLLRADVLARSSFDLARAQALARVFWPTRAYQQARTTLSRHRFVVMTGPPEMGKTAIAQMLALAQLTDGWEVHDCTDPEQVFRAFDGNRRQLFIADDAFGSTEYRPDAAERWALGLGRLLAMLDESHWLVWTSRPAPLKAGLRRVQRERGSGHFPSPGEVLVDASDLDLEEKTLILFRHAKSEGVTGQARRRLRSAGVSIVEHPHFTPERIRRLVTDRFGDLQRLDLLDQTELRLIVERELASPTDAMRTSFDALEAEHRDLLRSLLDAPAGLIDERELTAALRRHHPGGLSRPSAELIDRLTDHFLRVTPLGIGWVHPSWRDLVIEQLADDSSARQRFLSVCGVDGITLALSQEGGRGGERQLPLLEQDADWDRLGDRVRQLLGELETRELLRLLLALEAAVVGTADPRKRREALSLATQTLEATRQLWDRAGRAVPAFVLEAWFRLERRVPQDIPTPSLTTTWAELHPGSGLVEHPDRDELLRADEWLALAQVLRDNARPELEALHFFTRDMALLESLTTALFPVALTQSEVRPLIESVLGRVEDLIPELAEHARSASYAAGAVDTLEQDRWWAPQDIAAPPSRDLASSPGDFTAVDVSRVLSDL